MSKKSGGLPWIGMGKSNGGDKDCSKSLTTIPTPNFYYWQVIV
jgi:hypothetical protein